ncbi:MAG TPA: hypothetical protein DCO79_03095 [Spirochaeta sp.]|nr:hypothetical protein [Spirochaeta sp.]
MKKILITIAVLAVVSLGFFSCVFFMPQTYHLLDADSCIEYTTADFDTKLLIQLVGFEDGECPTDNVLGTCKDSYEAEGLMESLDTVYYDTIGTAADAQLLCEYAEGTWVPE